MQQKDKQLEQLLKIFRTFNGEVPPCFKDEDYDCGGIVCDECYTPFAEHLLANGVIAPPVKVGQTVYIINEDDGNGYPDVLDVTVSAVGRDVGGVWVTLDLPFGMKQSGYIGSADIGRTIHFSYEGAKRTLTTRKSKG